MNRPVRVGDVLLPIDRSVVLESDTLMRVAIEDMSRKRLGIACIVEADGTLLGVFTDGDIRRLLLHHHKPMSALFSEDIGDHAIRAPKTASPEMPLSEAISLMESSDVYDLPVVSEQGQLLGLLHIHTALKTLLSH